MKAPVLLLHGVWMRGPSLALLAYRLSQQGFEPKIIGYPSIFGGTDKACRRIHQAIRADDRKPHLVGHSLGGLMALLTLQQYPDLAIGRLVCLGSPLQGSTAARSLVQSGHGWILGKSAQLLQQGIGGLPGKYEIGMLAGNQALGIGRAFAHLPDDSDGTVAVSETQCPGLSDHQVIHTSHTGLLFSPQAAELTANFLRQGKFQTQ